MLNYKSKYFCIKIVDIRFFVYNIISNFKSKYICALYLDSFQLTIFKIIILVILQNFYALGKRQPPYSYTMPKTF